MCFEYSFQEYFFIVLLIFLINLKFTLGSNIFINLIDMSFGSWEDIKPELSLKTGVFRPDKFVTTSGVWKWYESGITPLCVADLYVKETTSAEQK